MKGKTKKLVLSALIAALACVATLAIHIPMPVVGYINLGDCIVLVGGWLLGPVYGFLAAGIGSALADVFLGYTVYAPVTFVIKGVMALVAYSLFKALGKIKYKPVACIISGAVAELIMVAGYCVFEGLMYGFGTAFASIPFNAIQGVVGLIVGTLLSVILDKTHATKYMK